MIMQISIGMACAAFIVLVCFLVAAVKESRSAMQQAQQSLARIELELARTTEASVQLIRQSSQVLEDVQRKLKAADGFVDAMDQTGAAANRLSQSVQQVSRTLTETVLEAKDSLGGQKDTVRDLIELTSTGMHLWQRWQAHRLAKAAAQTDEQS